MLDPHFSANSSRYKKEFKNGEEETFLVIEEVAEGREGEKEREIKIEFKIEIFFL
jgi:hypothetical protein